MAKLVSHNPFRQRKTIVLSLHLQTVSQTSFNLPQGVSPAEVRLTAAIVLSCVNSKIGLTEVSLVTLRVPDACR